MIIWLLIISLLFTLVIFFATYALPSIYLKMRYTVDKSNDRCIKRVYDRYGQCLVFEPEEKWRDYIEQYVLAERKDKKEVICKIDKSLEYIEYDIVVFNSMDKVSEIINTKEKVDGKGYTTPVLLPEDASYISINIIRADEKTFKENLTAKVTTSNKWKFLIINAALVIVEVVGLKICLANLFGGLFRESVIINLGELLFSITLAGVLILFNTITSLVAVKYREKNFAKKEEKNA